MEKPKIVFGSYEVDELKWYFFTDEKEAIDFQLEKENRIGPERFSFDDALQQFSNDLCAIPETLFVTEDEFFKIAKGEEVELSFLSSETEEENDLGEVEKIENSRPDPSEGYFEDTSEALLWLRACSIYIIDELISYASEREDSIEAFDYYDGFLSRLETLVDKYLGDIDDFEKISADLYDGCFMKEDEEK